MKSNVNESGASMSNNEIPEAHNGINVQGLNDRSLSVMEGGADPTGVKSNVNKSGASMSNKRLPDQVADQTLNRSKKKLVTVNKVSKDSPVSTRLKIKNAQRQTRSKAK